jgi:hypothetical protein
MSYRLSHIGEAAAAEAQQPQPTTADMAVASTQIMLIGIVPWVPVVGGVWVGRKIGGKDAGWAGGMAGAVLSVVLLTSMLKSIQKAQS